MILGYHAVEDLIKSGDIKLEGPFKMQPCSVDVYYDIESEIILPGHSGVTLTFQGRVELSTRVCGLVIPRSSSLRAGMLTPGCALIDPGYKGTLTTRVYNTNSIPVFLNSDTPGSQIIFQRVENSHKLGYGHEKWESKYVQD
nr:MAG TPA: dCTP deaminase dUTPase [Caudoviricetes sp.]